MGDLSKVYDFLRHQGFKETPKHPEPNPQTSPRNPILEVPLPTSLLIIQLAFHEFNSWALTCNKIKVYNFIFK